MEAAQQSAGGTGAPTSRAARTGNLTVDELVELYWRDYVGRDSSRPHRIAYWAKRLRGKCLVEVTDDDIYFALEDLAAQRGRYFAGEDADGHPIFRAKSRPLSPATINRYLAAVGAMFTWAIGKRIAPRGWTNP